MAWQSGLAGERRPVPQPRHPGGRLPRRARPERRRRALGGAERLLALDDRRRDRRADRGVARSRRVNHDAAHAAAVPGDRRPVRAQDQGLDGHDERDRTAPRYFLRLSKTGDPNAAISLRARQRQRHRRPALGSSTQGFLELVRLGVLPASDPDVTRVARGRRQGDPAPRRRTAPASTATARTPPAPRTATATASSRTRRPARRPARRGRRPTRAPGTCGRCSAASAASTTSRRGNRAGGDRAAERDGAG